MYIYISTYIYACLHSHTHTYTPFAKLACPYCYCCWSKSFVQSGNTTMASLLEWSCVVVKFGADGCSLATQAAMVRLPSEICAGRCARG